MERWKTAEENHSVIDEQQSSLRLRLLSTEDYLRDGLADREGRATTLVHLPYKR
jgi:hypothetical protein